MSKSNEMLHAPETGGKHAVTNHGPNADLQKRRLADQNKPRKPNAYTKFESEEKMEKAFNEAINSKEGQATMKEALATKQKKGLSFEPKSVSDLGTGIDSQGKPLNKPLNKVYVHLKPLPDNSVKLVTFYPKA